MILEYEANGIIVTIDGTDYPVHERTAEFDEELRQLDLSLNNRNEYEANTKLIDAFLGKGASRKIFPNGKKENLDKIMYYAQQIKDAYYHNYNEMRKAEIEKSTEPLVDLAEKLKPLGNINQRIK